MRNSQKSNVSQQHPMHDSARKTASRSTIDSENDSEKLITDESAAQRRSAPPHVAQNATAPMHDLPENPPPETGGQAGPEPTRYGDWEKKGRCTDF